MTGNMRRGGSVNDDGLTAPAPEPQAPEPEYYVMASGDTLWAIAAKFLGNGNKYPEIFEANREAIVGPDKIFGGQNIRIPK
jgi:nucleoid-associated protein YgaU